MDLTLTDECARRYPGVTLENFIEVGWSADQLVERGLATRPKPEPAADIEPIFHNEFERLQRPPENKPREAPPNIFGVKDLAVVSEIWREITQNRKTKWRQGWSFEQHNLMVAEELVKRYLPNFKEQGS